MGKRSPILVSNECFLQPLWVLSFDVMSPQNYNFTVADHLDNFSRYAWHNKGNVRALVRIRGQAEQLVSYYAQASKSCNASQSDFEKRVRAFLKRDDHTGWRFLDYNLLYRDLCTALGPDKVTFLAYEDMRTPHYWQVLNNLLDVDFEMPQNTADAGANVRRNNDKEWQLRPRRPHFYEKLPKRPFKLRKCVKTYEHRITRALTNQHKKTIHIPDDLRREVMDVYADSNRAIADIMNRDLSANGYY